ncbi:hypothetical protein Zmor_005277 [Zophobas morio]|uniref:Uncharacterized protein n=1 Tax=Zophobas morio TaxID=2755281 RepID=A0AA38MM88_9CUCU|nr:hypothetical protein Zmor_005277 [Zophobas morio]
MPASLSGSYRSLSGSSDVYRSTTVAGGGGNAAAGIIEGMKKAFSFMAGGTSKDQKLIERVAGGGPVVISSRYCERGGLAVAAAWVHRKTGGGWCMGCIECRKGSV